ncbi:hypothetical protein ACFOPN_15780 [Xanthomonas hyacinthi]
MLRQVAQKRAVLDAGRSSPARHEGENGAHDLIWSRSKPAV